MANLLEKVNKLSISRRNFIKASAVATAGVSLAGCGNSLIKTSGPSNAIEEGGEWITAACWHNCGGRCLNKALVVDGVVVRQKTDDTHTDSLNYPQQRACVRGRAQRQQIFGADRLKYPMKRKHWEPGGGKKELRGQDEWVRISWDEALDIVASELKRIKENYGNRAIMSCSQNSNVNGSPLGPHDIGKVLSLFGGCTTHTGTKSWGTWKLTPSLIGKLPESMAGLLMNDRFDLLNSETVILWGCNPAWNSPASVYYTKRIKEAGAKFISIDPFYNDSASFLDAEWVPTRPVTDTALMLAIAHAMITMDDPVSNPIIDWEFLKKNTLGFDADSMPEGVDPKENFKDYVLGTYDGIPKSPEWASKICGVEPNKIRYLAGEMRKDKKVALIIAYSSARNKNVDNLPQLFMTLGAMGGHMGKSGHCTGVASANLGFGAGPLLVTPGTDGLPPITNPVEDCIRDPELWPAILNEKYNYVGNFDLGVHLPSEIRDIDIRLLYHGSIGAILQSRDGMQLGIEAHRKVDFVVTHAFSLNTQAKYSDLILPITTEWERIGGFSANPREMMVMYSQVAEPLYEAKDDQWIAIELAKRLGIDYKEAFPFDAKQQFFNKIVGSKVVNENGKGMRTLVTITEKDIKEWGVQGTPQEGVIGLKELQKQGIYHVERKPGDNHRYIAFKDAPTDKFFEESKILIHSQQLEETINNFGFSKIRAIPTYIEPEDGYEKTFADWDKQIKGEYSFQVINPHYLRRSHTVLDNVPWLREAWPNPVFINEDDAKKHGITDGDTVLMSSPHGKTLRLASLTQRLMPGVIALPHGSWVDIDEKTGIDTGGADNMLCGAIATGQGTSGWNTAICNIEKYAGKAIVADVEKPQRIVL